LLHGKGVKVLRGAYRGIPADTLEDLEACSERGKPWRQAEGQPARRQPRPRVEAHAWAIGTSRSVDSGRRRQWGDVAETGEL